MHFSRGVLAACFALLPPLVGGAATNTTRTRVTSGNYHSLTESYQFDPRDGWESVMVTNLRYKYRRSSTGMTSTATPVKNSSSALKRPSSTSTQHSSAKSIFRSVGESLAELTKGIIATGKAEDVIITWFDTFVRQQRVPHSGTSRYTGHDLLNPSCWTEPTWSPTVLHKLALFRHVAHSQIHPKGQIFCCSPHSRRVVRKAQVL